MDMRLAAAAVCGGLLLSACAPLQPTRPLVPVFTPQDCASLYPHPESLPDFDPTAAVMSPTELAAQGEARLALARYRGCVVANDEGENHYLATLGKQLQYDHDQLNSDIAALTKRQDADAAAKTQYQADCNQPGLSHEQYLSCLQRAKDLNAEIAAVSQANSALKQRQSVLTASIQDYNQRIAVVPATVRDDFAAYTLTLKAEGAWLDRTRYLVNSPQYHAAAATAGCPDVTTPAKTVEGMHAMADATITCLKRPPFTP